MPVPGNISSKDETDHQRDRVITPDRLHYSDDDSDDDDGLLKKIYSTSRPFIRNRNNNRTTAIINCTCLLVLVRGLATLYLMS